MIFFCSSLVCHAADVDWTKARAEAVQLLQELIRIDTTNPPGNELHAAQLLKKVLDADGIENRILNVSEGRANLYARIKGDGSRRPLILLSHTDVVMADPVALVNTTFQRRDSRWVCLRTWRDRHERHGSSPCDTYAFVEAT